MFAILLVPLIGFVAIAVDVGALYAERAQLQNGADAAALAIAQDCADDGVCGDSAGIAARFADANANDGAANVLTPTFPTSHSVIVTSSTREAGTNAPAISHPFAALIGADPDDGARGGDGGVGAARRRLLSCRSPCRSVSSRHPRRRPAN